MAIRSILTYPDPFLKKIPARVKDFGPELQRLIGDMADTMYEAPGVGLAANQIGEDYSLLIFDAEPDPEVRNFKVLANPELLESEGSFLSEDEGCLSVPDFRANVKRHARIKVSAMDERGEPLVMDLEGFEAVIVQHEMDHLRGILFIDHISSLKRSLYVKRVNKQLRREAV
ncbi:peptide deformylase [Desulfobotulus alkaliphilus]|uniref:Peptide deformylase n=1 Tax=Desulfobotulus alkaliphilus TaxID=622671 RepID=A0A562RQ14_9BACT|nr:peptide deformylase [Desulfobotulus alkaliphilus]TWI71207.1 peptide deformylase [Desulfobotulus alkaliphilus]